jgi:hypothetical protein
MRDRIKNVCVYGASSKNLEKSYIDAAFQLGALLGSKGINVINGAGNFGLMRAVSDGALSVGGTATGIIPTFMIEREWLHKGLTNVIQVDTMHERKHKMAEMADGTVACPGGYGTFEELLEVIAWRQLGIYDSKIVILNTNDYYRPLLDMFAKGKKEGFIHTEDDTLWNVADTPEEAVELLLN